MKMILFSLITALNMMNTHADTYKKPSFPGGNEALVSFIQKELMYPETARENLTEGIAEVCLLITAEGNIKNCEISGVLRSDLKNAVEVMVAKMPRWTPALHQGKAVPKKVRFTITFDLTDV